MPAPSQTKPRRSSSPSRRAAPRSDSRSQPRRAPAPSRPPEPLPPVECTVELVDDGVAALAKRLREGRKAHPLFETVRKMFDRPQYLRFTLQPQQGATLKFHSCAACNEPFLSLDEVVAHQFHRHSDATFSRVQTEIEPPKGNFAIIAICGFCHEPLCPPNFHRYTEMLIAHHKRRHGRDHFDELKSRVKMSREAEDLEAWKKSLSTREEISCKHCDKKFQARPEFQAHLAADHAALLEKIEDRVALTGEQAQRLDCAPLRRVIARALDTDGKVPTPWFGRARQLLNTHGLQYFRNAAGHQFINHIQPRRPTEGVVTDPLQLEILRIASAPARRGHKPTFKTLADQFCAPPVSGAEAAAPDKTKAMENGKAFTEAQLQTGIASLVERGFLVEYMSGEFDAPVLAKEETSAEPVSA